MKLDPHLDAREFDRLANATRLGPRAREMARLTLVEGHSMQQVAKNFDTIPQRVGLAVGSIHRVQASLSWSAEALPGSRLPDGLVAPLTELIATFNTLQPGQIDEAVIADLQSLLHQARQRLASV